MAWFLLSIYFLLNTWLRPSLWNLLPLRSGGIRMQGLNEYIDIITHLFVSKLSSRLYNASLPYIKTWTPERIRVTRSLMCPKSNRQARLSYIWRNWTSISKLSALPLLMASWVSSSNRLKIAWTDFWIMP